MSTLLYHPTGNANVRAAALGLAKAGQLHSFHTSVASFPDNLIDRLSKISALSEFSKRQFDPALQHYTHTWPWMELARLASLKSGFSKLVAHETGLFCIDNVLNRFDKHISSMLSKYQKQGVTAIYAYEDAALHSFMEAQRLQMQCMYDLPIGYWRAARSLLRDERERRPQWASTLTGFRDSEKKILQKDAEIKLADRIFVASSFTAETLKEYPGVLPPVEVIPYGFPEVGAQRIYEPLKGRPLKVLFVGGLSQRKGIADLFEAAGVLGNNINLTIVGKKTTAECKALDEALKKYTWIPALPHAALLKLMREQDVLVFPSLFEGFGLVITEAMSQGTPVITTERTAGPDLIQHGYNGWLIEAGSAVNIQQAIEYLISNPDLVAQAGIAAMETAAKRPWSQYGAELAAALHNDLLK